MSDCSQYKTECDALDKLNIVQRFNDISGFSKLWHQCQRDVVSKWQQGQELGVVVLSERLPWEAAGIRLQVTLFSCSLADDKIQDNGTCSHSPVERQTFLVHFFWQIHLQTLRKKNRLSLGLWNTVRLATHNMLVQHTLQPKTQILWNV